MSSGERSNSVVRANALIGLVADAGLDGISLIDLSRTSGLPASTCHRYISTLLDLMILERDAGGRLSLGVGLVTLAGRYLEGDVVRNLARPSLVRLSDASGETVHLGVLAGDEVVYIDKVDSVKSVRLVSHIGKKAPLYCTGMGKAILANLPEQRRERLVSSATERLTPHTLLGDDLRRSLAEVRETGWALDDQENEEGVRCLAVAITSSEGTPVGALSISGPANRFSREECARLAPQAMNAATDIGHQMAWRQFQPRITPSEGALL